MSNITVTTTVALQTSINDGDYCLLDSSSVSLPYFSSNKKVNRRSNISLLRMLIIFVAVNIPMVGRQFIQHERFPAHHHRGAGERAVRAHHYRGQRGVRWVAHPHKTLNKPSIIIWYRTTYRWFCTKILTSLHKE